MPNEIKKKKKLWNSSSIIFILFLNFDRLDSIFYQSSFTLKLDFEKIEFQNKDILLNFLKK